MKITEYTTNQGTRYQVTGYLGMDETTGRQKNFKRKGFKTKKEAQNSFTRAKHEFNTGCYSVQSKTLTYEQVYREWW
ncbi:MAG: Arm DNA-binding domain-containing protein [Aerococcaceae bacterium]|nr:Arm DNA-binding domain-containing protein [Aerococcaceae bacterium]